MKMNYIFFGGQESPFAEIILQELNRAGFPPLYAIRDARKPIDLAQLTAYHADFFLVAAFAKILKTEVLSLPPHGTIGVHPSLLPKYRGASPIQSALLQNEKETGTTLFLIDEKIDHGSMLAQRSLPIIPEETYTTLLEKLAYLSAKTIQEVLPQWLEKKIPLVIQDEAAATYTKKILTADAAVDFVKDSPEVIWSKIRALNPEPGVFSIIQLSDGASLRLKLHHATFINGQLNITHVQPEGKKILLTKDFLNGYRQLLPASALIYLRG